MNHDTRRRRPAAPRGLGLSDTGGTRRDRSAQVPTDLPRPELP